MKFLGLSFLLLLVSTGAAQRTAYYTDRDQLYRTGLELFDKQQYASAERTFQEFSRGTRSTLLRADAEYYAAACGIELFHKDGEWLMRKFITDHPGHPKTNLAWFYLAKSNFRKKKYKETADYLSKIDIYALDKDQLAELRFKKGYSLLQTGNEEGAKTEFFEIKDKPNEYKNPALFYYSHILYKEKKYELAVAGFRKLLTDETFKSVVPYYITQIYFIEGKYDRVIEEVKGLLNDSNDVQKEAEINRMTGESYFNLKRYPEALEYLKKSNLDGPKGNYAIAYCYYQTNDCVSALKHFEFATADKDTVAQNAWYHMAACYLKTGDKPKAKNAFYNAYQIGIDPMITEDALFSYAKLSYELDFNPYNDAVRAFGKYLKEYPNAKRAGEAYGFLINVYSTTKNYAMAIKSLESLGDVDVLLKVTYEKLVYFLGVDYFNNGDLVNAEKQFKKALSISADPGLNSLAQYWLSEVYYIRKDYSTAIDSYKKFQGTNGATQLREYELSNYDLGYAYFQRRGDGDFGNANISFRKFLLAGTEYGDMKVADATVRVADCYFMNRDFVQAGTYYQKAVELNKVDVDYSIFRKAICDGLKRSYDEKVAGLKKLESNYPNSTYKAEAVMELADTYYRNLKDYGNAIAYYEKVLKDYPNSTYAQLSYAQLGNIYFEQKRDDQAFRYYNLFVQTDSKSESAKQVLDAIKKIFDTKGDLEGERRYFDSIGNPLSVNELEKKMYLAAYEANYNQKDCDAAMPRWDSYIRQFPNGKYILEAQNQYAECAYSKGQFDKALTGYLYVINNGRSAYTENALAKVTYLYFKDKKFTEALPLFQQYEQVAETPANMLQARLGTMRCAFNVGNFDVALEASSNVLATQKITPQQTAEARWIHAKSLFEMNRMDDALTEFRQIVKSSKNVTGAEAYYHIALIQYKRQEYAETEKTLNQLISYSYSNDTWNNKGMLLLADVLMARKELNDAEVILQTIIDSQPAKEFVDQANAKLEAVRAAIAEQEKKAAPAVENPLEIQFNQGTRDSSLFHQELPK